MSTSRRIGLIVPSSNVTMETEIPALLARQAGAPGFTFHSSRMRMRQVTKEELARMDAESDRCARELADARCDAMAYACLVAVMAGGKGYHLATAERLGRAASEEGHAAPVVTSAGALLGAVKAMGARRIAMITPYMKALTRIVVDYFEDAQIEVVDAISLEVADNQAVGRLDPAQLPGHAARLNLDRVDAVVLSACVQMPSLPSIQIVEDQLGIPVLSAATATAYDLLNRLGLSPDIANAGRLLRPALSPSRRLALA
jgi:maleate isomerase